MKTKHDVLVFVTSLGDETLDLHQLRLAHLIVYGVLADRDDDAQVILSELFSTFKIEEKP